MIYLETWDDYDVTTKDSQFAKVLVTKMVIHEIAAAGEDIVVVWLDYIFELLLR